MEERPPGSIWTVWELDWLKALAQKHEEDSCRWILVTQDLTDIAAQLDASGRNYNADTCKARFRKILLRDRTPWPRGPKYWDEWEDQALKSVVDRQKRLKPRGGLWTRVAEQMKDVGTARGETKRLYTANLCRNYYHNYVRWKREKVNRAIIVCYGPMRPIEPRPQ